MCMNIIFTADNTKIDSLEISCETVKSVYALKLKLV
jgi:hypothetical protein